MPEDFIFYKGMMKGFPERLLKTKFKFYFLQSIALMFIVIFL